MSKTAGLKKKTSQLVGGADSHGKQKKAGKREGNAAVENEATAKVESLKDSK